MLRDGIHTCTCGIMEPIFLLAEVAAMRDKENGKANDPNIDNNYEEVAA